MANKVWLPALALSLPMLSLLAGCNRGASKVVGVVPKGANHVFWQTVHAGAVKAARESGLQVEWSAPTLETDSSRQVEILDSMINRHLAGIAVAPVDRQAMVSVVERATREGIPVAIFDSAIDTDKIVSFVATDNREGGRIAARRMCEILGGKGKVGVMGFMAGSASTMEREDGFEQEIKKCPGVQYVGIQRGVADRAKAMSLTENMLTANSDLAGIFADNESSSSGAVQALKSRNNKQVKLIAFDASDQLVADMREGWIDSLIVQNPFKMGYESVKAIGQKIAGQTPVRTIDSGVTLVKREDAGKPEIKALLFPDIEQYLK